MNTEDSLDGLQDSLSVLSSLQLDLFANDVLVFSVNLGLAPQLCLHTSHLVLVT